MSTDAPIRVLIADDKELDREGVKALLSNQPEIEVVGTAATSSTVVQLVQELKPDVLLADLHWHGNATTGARIIREVRALMPEIRVVAHSQYPELIDMAMEAGADEAVTKEYDRKMLISLLMGVCKRNPVTLDSIQKEEQGILTARECEVLQLIAKGNTAREIAAKLYLTNNTVRQHVKNIFVKLEVQSRAEAVSRAYQKGILSPDE